MAETVASRRVGSRRSHGSRVIARADVSTSLPLATDFTCRNYVNINGQSQQVIFWEISFFDDKKLFSVLEQYVLKWLVLFRVCIIRHLFLGPRFVCTHSTLCDVINPGSARLKQNEISEILLLVVALLSSCTYKCVRVHMCACVYIHMRAHA